MQKKEYSFKLGEQELTLRFLNWAEQANASVLAQLGETVVLTTAVMGNKDSELPYFPLTIEYREKYYAAGIIGGGRFSKREGRPSDEATLRARLIDRTIRPLFNNSLRRDIQIVNTVLSYDGENTPEILSLIASSVVLSVSNIPWDGPVGGARIAKVDNKWKVSPSKIERENSDADVIVSGPKNNINMIEVGANELQEKDLLEAMKQGQNYINELTDFQEKIQKEIGQEKEKVEVKEASEELKKEVNEQVEQKIRKTIIENSVTEEKKDIEEIKNNLKDYLVKKYEEENPQYIGEALDYFDNLMDKLVHEAALKYNKRVDGRAFDEIRPLFAEMAVLPRTHGSGIFMRGLTHVLSTATLDSPGEEELRDEMEGEGKKRFMHHYNFPPFSVGETGWFRAPGRREIGHGSLAEKALAPLIPSLEKFPYVIRVVSEAISSNGSTSMASVCGSSLALMDAGVPIKGHVAGIAMGVISPSKNSKSEDKSAEQDDNKDAKIITDITGLEDHYGGMDFKVAGTKDGITAIQLDVKTKGLNLNLIEQVLNRAKSARLQIIGVLENAVSKPRESVSKYAPIIRYIKIKPTTIAILIGSGGRTIKGVMNDTGTEIDVEDDGAVYVSGNDKENVEKAITMIEGITHQVEVGEIYNARVVRVADFGAFVELTPGQEALVHVSELSKDYVKNVKDVAKIGDTIKVKIIRIDEEGKIAASAKINESEKDNI